MKFIEQQSSIIPERYRSKPLKTPPGKLIKKRGRKKSIITLKRFLLLRTLKKMHGSGKKFTREELAAALGLDPRCVNTMAAAFERTTPEENEKFLERQLTLNKIFCKSKKFTAVPLLDIEDIYQRDFELKTPPRKCKVSLIHSDPDFMERIHYFAFIMPDNCMLHDGICKGDTVIAAKNVRPTHGDMVVCRIPGVRTITVRRFGVTSNPSLFNLYEGGTINELQCAEIENLIFGVVIGIERTYRPSRLPYPSAEQ